MMHCAAYVEKPPCSVRSTCGGPSSSGVHKGLAFFGLCSLSCRADFGACSECKPDRGNRYVVVPKWWESRLQANGPFDDGDGRSADLHAHLVAVGILRDDGHGDVARSFDLDPLLDD